MNNKKILYLGWLGKGNVGDDLLFDIFKIMINNQLSKKQMNVIVDGYLPLDFYEVDMNQYELIVLGGGSLLGIDYWEDICLKCSAIGKKVIIWGTGIDIRDDYILKNVIESYNKNQNHSKENYIGNKTKDVITCSFMNGIRGNITKFILNSSKVNVIGDAGIIFNKLGQIYPNIEELKAFQSIKKELVLINWGTSFNNILGSDEQNAEYHLEIATQILLNKGYKVAVYPIWTEDIEVCKKFANNFKNEDIICIDKVYDVYGIASLINMSKFTINFKLHANILSMALKKPFISLAYGLKCYDFAESVDSAELLINTNDINTKYIIEKVEYILNNYNQIVEKFESKINTFYEIHEKYMLDIVDIIGSVK